MYHVDNPSTVTEMPEITAVQNATPQWFTDTEGGDGAPTYPGAEWFNIVQAELLAILAAAGIVPDKTDTTQLAQAVQVLAGAGVPEVNSVGAYGFMVFQDGEAHHVEPGAIVSGELLRFCGTTVTMSSPVPLGSWQCMGAITNASDRTLFVRVI